MTNKAADKHAIASAVFSVRGLCKIYGTGKTEVHALRGVDLDLREGKLAVL
jgi:putative ABC transport system ATP-binding protein|tara:strand:+ start:1327 stop:1479 length:153 start_codon:yes stop_codon:yes gene_type:complete